jgi:hypothetical protein
MGLQPHAAPCPVLQPKGERVPCGITVTWPAVPLPPTQAAINPWRQCAAPKRAPLPNPKILAAAIAGLAAGGGRRWGKGGGRFLLSRVAHCQRRSHWVASGGGGESRRRTHWVPEGDGEGVAEAEAVAEADAVAESAGQGAVGWPQCASLGRQGTRR